MTGTATTFDNLVTNNTANVRKALRGGVLWAPISTAIPASLTIDSPTTPGTPVLQTLTGFNSLGCFSDDGAKFSRDIKDSTITPWGFLDPARRDIVTDVTSVDITGLETNKQMLALFHGVDASTLTPDSTTGELHIDKAASAQAVYFRLIVFGQDGAAGSEYWTARFLPRASVTSVGDQVFQSGDTPIEYPVTITAYKDTTAGYADRTIWAGPGWLTNKTAAGF
jgi:hypothetical protein